MTTLENQMRIDNIKSSRVLWIITLDEAIKLFREYIKNQSLEITKNLKWKQ
jgi:hypothetical protein